MQEKLIILDLDETLIYSTEVSLSYKEDFKIENFFVYKRPGLDDFLLGVQSLFKVAVWTASGVDYANEVIKNIFPSFLTLEFIFTRERCLFRYDPEMGNTQIIKPLKKVCRRGFSKSQIIVIDDLPETFQQNYGNAILVRRFHGERTDKELFLLLDYMKVIADTNDLLVLDKRNWRSQV